jgi:SAM-dependent methyltransferase
VCAAPLGAPLLRSPDRWHRTPGSFSVARCGACGVAVTLPTALAAEQLATFYPSTYGAYGFPSGVLGLCSALIRGLQSRQALRTEPLRRLAEMPPGRLLDVGCGRGDLGAWLHRRGWTAVGVEPSIEACALARTHGVDARPGTLGEVALEPRSFDAAVFRQSLEHVSDPLADLRRVRTALRPEGLLVISVPNFGCWQRRRFGGHWFHLDVPRHRFHFDADALRGVLERAGFEDIRTSTSSSTVGLPASIQYTLAGRCLFPGGLGLRIAGASCALALPPAWLLARMTGAGDVLHAVARKPARLPREAAPAGFASVRRARPRASSALSETGTETVSSPIAPPAWGGARTA